MKFCKNCLQPDTRPGTVFTDIGLCPACSYSNSLSDVDFSHRWRLLQEIKDFGIQNKSSKYDSIIGVSGGKDSTRQAIFVKENLGMNPLLVCLSPSPHMSTQRGVNNLSNLISLGFDCVNIYPAPETWRQLMRLSFFKYTNPFKSTELALFSSVPRLAIMHQIPLVWWGENSALQLGESSVMGKDGSDGNNLKNMNTLSGGDISWMIEDGFDISKLIQYRYPSDEELERANLKITFLGFFWRDWSLINNGEYSMLRGLDIRSDKPWEMGEHVGITALDEDWTPVNQMIKYLKYGFGRTTDYINEDIRNGAISREQGIELVEKFDGTCSVKYILGFCDYIGISTETFWSHLEENAINWTLFEKIELGTYKRKFRVGAGI